MIPEGRKGCGLAGFAKYARDIMGLPASISSFGNKVVSGDGTSYGVKRNYQDKKGEQSWRC